MPNIPFANLKMRIPRTRHPPTNPPNDSSLRHPIPHPHNPKTLLPSRPNRLVDRRPPRILCNPPPLLIHLITEDLYLRKKRHVVSHYAYVFIAPIRNTLLTNAPFSTKRVLTNVVFTIHPHLPLPLSPLFFPLRETHCLRIPGDRITEGYHAGHFVYFVA